MNQDLSPLENSQRRNEEALIGVLLDSIPMRETLERLASAEDVSLFNVIQFALLFNFDISCLTSEIHRQRGNWRSKLYARQLVVTIYECLEDFSALLGGDFRRNLTRFSDGNSLLPELNSLLRRLQVFRSAHSRDYKTVRNTVLAHREHDAREQIDVLRSLSVDDVLGVGYELIDWLNALYGFLSPLVGRIKPRLGIRRGGGPDDA